MLTINISNNIILKLSNNYGKETMGSRLELIFVKRLNKYVNNY